jgi:DNA-binding response OmpR family regulator
VSPRIAIVDDDADLAHLLEEVLAPLGEVVAFNRTTVTPGELDAFAPDVIVIDPIRGTRGTRPSFGVVRAVRTDGRLLGVALLVCSEPHAVAARRDELEPFRSVHFLAKPFDLEQIEAALEARLRGETPPDTELPEA